MSTPASKVSKLITDMEKLFGSGSLMAPGLESIKPVDVVSTGSVKLDMITGVYGIPRGRVVEIFGPEAGGKTTLALHIIAEAQSADSKGVCAFIDAEHALSFDYAKAVGCNLDRLLLSQPDSGEQALNICEALVKTGDLDVIVIDSVAALVPEAELAGEVGDVHVAPQARMMSQALRKLTGCVAKTKTVVIFINQIREKIGIKFGNKENTTGGRALKFYSSMRLDVRRIASVKSGSDIIGNKVRVKVAKNKLALPFRECETTIIFGMGINLAEEVAELGLDYAVYVKEGKGEDAQFFFCTDKQDKHAIGKNVKEITRFFTYHTLCLKSARARIYKNCKDKIKKTTTETDIYGALVAKGLIVEKGGGWSVYDGEKFLKKQFTTFLDVHPQLRDMQ